MVLWAHLEHALLIDMQQLLQIAQRQKTSTTFDVKIRKAFNKRRELWFRLCETLYINIPHYLAHAKTIDEALQKVAAMRNILIHGMLETSGTPLEDGSIRLINIQPASGGKITLAEYKIDVPFLKTFGGDLREITDQIVSMGVNRVMGTHRVVKKRS
jgi:hypothetical protein